ncbi:MAG: IS481 family transposase [bacterium]|nr:IS481 family transposase [bacterium]
MSEKGFIYHMRVKIFEEADKKEIPITSLCSKYHVSRKWFYPQGPVDKWKKRRDKEGNEGLRTRVRASPKMPNKVSIELEEKILEFVREYPTYGSARISTELKRRNIIIGHTGIYNVLRRRGLHTAKMRLELVRKLNGEIVTLDELQRDKEKSKTNHIEVSYPGQLVSEDTFYIGCLKGVGRIYHQVACDCFSSFGAAKIYDSKTTDTSCDFVGNYLIKKFTGVRIERLLTDCGTEYTTWHEEAKPKHKFEKMCQRLGIRHTTTKVRHPWTNGYVERLNKTLLDEFYSLAFRKKGYRTIEELQLDLDEFMEYYNYRRTHQGYKLKENGCDTPAKAHLSKKLKQDLTKEMRDNKIGADKMIRGMLCRSRGEVIEKTILTGQVLGDNFTGRRSEKEEVLTCQFVTTS